MQNPSKGRSSGIMRGNRNEFEFRELIKYFFRDFKPISVRPIYGQLGSVNPNVEVAECNVGFKSGGDLSGKAKLRGERNWRNLRKVAVDRNWTQKTVIPVSDDVTQLNFEEVPRKPVTVYFSSLNSLVYKVPQITSEVAGSQIRFHLTTIPAHFFDCILAIAP